MVLPIFPGLWIFLWPCWKAAPSSSALCSGQDVLHCVHPELAFPSSLSIPDPEAFGTPSWAGESFVEREVMGIPRSCGQTWLEQQPELSRYQAPPAIPSSHSWHRWSRSSCQGKREEEEEEEDEKAHLDVKAEELCSSSLKTKIAAPSAFRGVLAGLIHGWEAH